MSTRRKRKMQESGFLFSHETKQEDRNFNERRLQSEYKPDMSNRKKGKMRETEKTTWGRRVKKIFEIDKKEKNNGKKIICGGQGRKRKGSP